MRASFLRGLCFLLFLWGTLGYAQNGFKATPLGLAVNSEYDESMPRLSEDGQRLYFVRGRHPLNVGARAGGQDIWYSERQADGAWAPAQNLGKPLNTPEHNAVGAILDDGNALLLVNTYSGPGKTASPGISISHHIKGLWSQPHPLIKLALEQGTLSLHAPQDQSVILLSMPAGPQQQEDLYALLPDAFGLWSVAPVPLGATLNTAGLETSPFLASDLRTLYFSSDGHGGAGSADILMSRRLDDTWTNWSSPVNLGPTVNTTGFDAHFILDAQGAHAYFVSGPTPQALGDIYTIPLREIPSLSPIEPSPISKLLPDTLRLFTRTDQSTPFSLEAYGIPSHEALHVSAKSMDGSGQIERRRVAPPYIYRPAPGFTGTELLMLAHCEGGGPRCKEIVVIAMVEAPDTRPQPVAAAPAVIYGSTESNTPMVLSTPPGLLETADLPTTRKFAQPGEGSLSIASAQGRKHLLYTPPSGMYGRDTVRLYRDCPQGNAEDCTLAIVIVEIDPPSGADTLGWGISIVEVPLDTLIVAPLPAETFVLSGKVYDAETGQALEANIDFFQPGQSSPVASVQSNAQSGAFELQLPAGQPYTYTLNKPYYFVLTESLDPVTLTARKPLVIPLAPMPMEVGQAFVLKDIYFDLDKSVLKPASKAELQRLYALLENHPSMEIEIRGHTDNTASDDYNLKLSTDRARAVCNYLKYMGIMGTRLAYRGLGETTPIAGNETEEGRALNRRVEFVIVKK